MLKFIEDILNFIALFFKLIIWVTILFGILWVAYEIFVSSDSTPDQATESKMALDRSQVNMSDPTSIDENYGSEAASACGYDADDYLRKIAKHDFKWDDDATGLFGLKFGSFLAEVSKPGVIVYVSDRATLQNGFGAFTRIKIYCEYDAKSNKVLGFYTNEP